MRIKWDREPDTIGQKVLADYLSRHSALVAEVIRLSSESNLLNASFTPQAFESGFFTYEIKKDPHADDYLVIVWRGIRPGDAVPVLYGRIDEIEGGTSKDDKG